MAVRYEYVVEILDFYHGCGEDPDIIDTTPFDTLEAAKDWSDKCQESSRIALRRDEGNDLGGLRDRGYAYYDDSGNLPERFETATGLQDGSYVPKRFHKRG